MADADAFRDRALSDRVSVGDTRPPAEPPAVPPVPPAVVGDDKVMSLVDHLTELRDRLIKCILAVALGGVVGWILTPTFMRILTQPIGNRELVFLSPGDGFMIYMKFSLLSGLVLGMPIILYQLWAFIAPGLTAEERKVIRPWVPMALFFFVLGVSIAYVVLPFALGFLYSFEQPGVLVALPDASAYFGFITTMFLAFGLVMEFPIVLFGLSRVGIVTSARLSEMRRYVVIGIAIFSAVVTPGGDVVSPLTLGGTMYVLYELTRFVIKRTGR